MDNRGHKKRPGFRICGNKGFHITFENGWTVSVQFGPGNYCDNYDLQMGEDEIKAGKQGSSTAECAIIDPKGNLFPYPDWGGDTVSNRSTPKDVAKFIQWAAGLGGANA